MYNNDDFLESYIDEIIIKDATGKENAFDISNKNITFNDIFKIERERKVDYRDKIFKMLGVEPNEEFKFANIKPATYRITKDFSVQSRDDRDLNGKNWRNCGDGTFTAILTGQLKIIKILKPTPKDQTVIEYAKLCGCKWIAKDEDGSFFGFQDKPLRYDSYWGNNGENDYIEIYHPISFLSWEDDEPFYIGD